MYPKSWMSGGGVFFMKFPFKCKLECVERFKKKTALKMKKRPDISGIRSLVSIWCTGWESNPHRLPD